MHALYESIPTKSTEVQKKILKNCVNLPESVFIIGTILIVDQSVKKIILLKGYYSELAKC